MDQLTTSHGLTDALQHYGRAYLLTSGAEGTAPHATAVRALWQEGELVIDGVGRRSLTHAQQRPAVALVWPPADDGGYSLIVDGQARAVDTQLRIHPTRAVLHRPSAAPASGDCGSDCTSDCIPLRIGA